MNFVIHRDSYIRRVLSLYTSDINIVKFLHLGLAHWLYARVKTYAVERGIPVVGAIRLILSEFFRNNVSTMTKIGELPDGVVDLGEGKGLAITMDKLRDKNGVTHMPPPHLSKEETIEWIRQVQEQIKNEESQ